MIWLAVVGTLNQSNAITMMSLLWWGALTNQNHSPREFTTGGHCGSLPQEVTMGVYCGRSPREFTAGGSMIWLAVVGTLNQSNAIIMMSLLWWGALTNQNHSPWGFMTAGHRGSLLREVTAGVYRRRSLQEFTMGVYHGGLLWVVTAGVYHGRSQREFTAGGSMIWLAVVGTLNQSNAITMMSLLWWGALTNQNHSPREFTTAGHRRRSPWEFTMGGYRGSLLRKFTAGGHRGSLPQEVTTGVYHGRFNDLIGCGGDT